MARGQDFYSEARAAVKQVWDGINKLKSLQAEYNALDYGTTLPNGEGANAPLTKTDVGAAVFDTANALSTVLSQGHATNLAKLL